MIKDKDYLYSYWQYLKKSKGKLMFATFLIPLITFLHLFQPILIKFGIDAAVVDKDLGRVYFWGGCFGGVLILEYVCRSLQGFMFQLIGQQTIKDIRQDLYGYILHFSPSYFDKMPIGTLTSRLTSDMESLNESFASGLITLIGDVLTLIGIIFAMYYLSPKLTFISVLVLPILFVVVNFFRIKLRYFFNKIRSTMGVLSGFLEEYLNGISIVHIFQQEKSVYKQFDDTNDTYRKSTIGAVIYEACLYSLVEGMGFVLIAVIIWFGWQQQLMGVITIGVLVAFIDYIHKFFAPLKEISNKFATLQHALAALEKIFGIFAVKDFVSTGSRKLTNKCGHIVFDDVSFSYKGHENKKVLRHLSFEVKPKQVVALVGPTGSGKTSVSRLISRMYEGYEGSITLEGYSLLDYDLKSLRSQIAVVTQDVQLFSTSVMFNITLGNEAINPELVRSCCEKIGLDLFINTLENGYDTVLENGADSLSAGQAQLISFVRALVSPAPIVLLDEATSSVDSLSEKLIQEATDLIFEDKTVIVVAHRLSTIKKADTIIAIKNGEIIESGSHEILMKEDGFYAKLFNMQFS